MSTITIGEAISSLLRDGLPVRFTAYDGSSAGPRDADIGLELLNERGLSYLLTAPGDLGMARAYVAGDLVPVARAPHRFDGVTGLRADRDRINPRRRGVAGQSVPLVQVQVKDVGLLHRGVHESDPNPIPDVGM